MVSKIIEVAFFCNVIIFYCFLESLETATVFFKKISILGQCYTFVHQNCTSILIILQFCGKLSWRCCGQKAVDSGTDPHQFFTVLRKLVTFFIMNNYIF